MCGLYSKINLVLVVFKRALARKQSHGAEQPSQQVGDETGDVGELFRVPSQYDVEETRGQLLNSHARFARRVFVREQRVDLQRRYDQMTRKQKLKKATN